ncbi:MAG: peroxiredoxin [Vicingaceae bacterium]
MSKLQVGDRIPDFCLPNQEGKEICISAEDGKSRIIYFYPKNNTKVCTEEACSFRDWYDDFLEAGYDVIGISGDSVSSHQKFKSQHHLNFQLLSDSKGKVRKMFGATTFFGLVPQRSTFAIDQKGVIQHRFDSLFDSTEHIDEMLEAIKK